MWCHARDRISRARRSTGRTAIARPMSRTRPAPRGPGPAARAILEVVRDFSHLEGAAMPFSESTPRRGFLARLAGATAVLSTGSAWQPASGTAQGQPAAHDRWLTTLKGKHRCLFDFPTHAGGLPLVHMLNYITTY